MQKFHIILIQVLITFCYFQPPHILNSLVCRYKPGKIPYVVYKEEIQNWKPRISMFYDVITDAEGEIIKELAAPKVCVFESQFLLKCREIMYPAEHVYKLSYKNKKSKSKKK